MSQCPYPETEAEYVESSSKRGGHCPNCGAWDVDYRSFDVEAAAVYQQADCKRCEFRFYDKYHLAGFVSMVPDEYFVELKQAAMDAEEIFTLDELEEHADVLRNECAGLP